MSQQPAWDSVDNYTSDLLSLVADEGHVSADYEWREFVLALQYTARSDGTINPNELRPYLRGVVAPRRIGAFHHMALTQGLIEYTGAYQISDDIEGRNSGKPCRVMRWLGSG